MRDEDIKYINELEERAQELERANKQLKGNLSMYKGYYKNMIKINEGIVEENKRYREALEFYADEENYFFDEKEYRVGLGVPESEITIDYGQKARKSLKGE